MSIIRTDVAVVGLGAMGAATLYQLARRGVSALGIDRYEPPHAMGSSHGETRITRCAVGEGSRYVPLVQRSHAIWRDLEAETGETLLDTCGFLIMAPAGVRTGQHRKPDFLQRTIDIARRHNIPHQELDAAAIGARFPNFGLSGNEEGYFEPGGGFVRPERCIAAQLQRARALGATVRPSCVARSISRQGNVVHVESRNGTIAADRVVIAAGAWAGKLLDAPFDRFLVPYRQVLHWFAVRDETGFRPGTMPCYIWMHGAQPEEYFYGFPAQPGTGEVKVATEQYSVACDPDAVSRDVEPGESAKLLAEHINGRLRGVNPAPARAVACFYTVAPDSGFVIDRHPDDEHIIVVSPCSGHGFKHSAAIGEAVAQLVCTGRSEIDLSPFRLDRLRALQKG